MVAAICGWHEHNERAARGLETRLDRGETMLIAAPALVETYAVLTRLPPPHRLAPEDALSLVAANFIAGAETITFDAAAYHHLLHDAPGAGIAGGRIYDRVIAACAIQAKATALLTFNVRDFAPFARDETAVVMPE
jgi:predicted nucleic acid-binding protein